MKFTKAFEKIAVSASKLLQAQRNRISRLSGMHRNASPFAYRAEGALNRHKEALKGEIVRTGKSPEDVKANTVRKSVGGIFKDKISQNKDVKHEHRKTRRKQ